MSQNKIIIVLILIILILAIVFGIKVIGGKNKETNVSDYSNNYVLNETNEEEYKTDNKVSSETINTTDEELEEESKELLNKVIKHRNEVYEHNQKVEATAENIASVIVLVIGIPTCIGLWKIFTREGIPGWTLLVPIYNYVQLCNVVGLTGWMVLLMFIPKIGGIIFFLIINYNLASKYDKGLGYTLGLTLLPFIFYPLLAFKEN